MKIHNHCLTSAEQTHSPNCDEREDESDISLIVIHCISLPEGQFGTPFIKQLFMNQLQEKSHASFAEICQLHVSSHLVIQRGGQVTQYVPFHKRAWHAGVSEYQGRTQCNDFSIGIELEGTSSDSYTEQQYTALTKVMTCLIQAYPKLSRERITGHSDIAPQRKTDPGTFFNWQKLYQLLG